MKKQIKEHRFYIYLVIFRGLVTVGVLLLAWDRNFWEMLVAVAIILIVFVVSGAAYAGIVYASIAEENRRKYKEAQRQKAEMEMKKKQDFLLAQQISADKYLQVTNYKDAARQKTPLQAGKPK